MAAITIQTTATEGAARTFVLVGATSDTFANTGVEVVTIRRGIPGTAGSGASGTRTATFNATTSSDPPYDNVWAITSDLASGATIQAGPFPTRLWGTDVTVTVDDGEFLYINVSKTGPGI